MPAATDWVTLTETRELLKRAGYLGIVVGKINRPHFFIIAER